MPKANAISGNNLGVDIRENDLADYAPELLDILLRDHTTGRNIFWATHDYEELGEGYGYADEIMSHLVSGSRSDVVLPRVLKSRLSQQARAKEMAEVFTPSWICNAQNNLVDSAWFGREGVFNVEVDAPDGSHSWTVNKEPVNFPEGKTWRSYVNENRLEITCGEAPYLVSRYDATTGRFIPIEERIGLLDRKLRVVSENCETSAEWLKAAQSAYQSIYGYDWQGDNLLLARMNLLHTFTDYYKAKFEREPLLKSVKYIAYIISWNIWQMDGLKCVVPDSCGERREVEEELFGTVERIEHCQGCRTDELRAHNGTYALVKDWSAKGEKQKIRFVDLIKG
ncbi:MAG: restriction endonuclease subunit M [Prevotellaceae bacterium]|nr:restriction endonuclease subunit M [Prevotellaceae bacterium]